MQADALADRHTDAGADIESYAPADRHAHPCADIESYALADRHAHSCADVESYALADRHAHSCVDVDVRACLHALYHARCGPTGTHAQACTMTHTYHGTCPCARTGTQSWALRQNVTELLTSAPGTALGLRR